MPFNFKIPFHRTINSGNLTEEEKLEKLKEFIIEQEKTAQSMCDNPDDVNKEAPTRKFNYSKDRSSEPRDSHRCMSDDACEVKWFGLGCNKLAKEPSAKKRRQML